MHSYKIVDVKLVVTSIRLDLSICIVLKRHSAGVCCTASFIRNQRGLSMECYFVMALLVSPSKETRRVPNRPPQSHAFGLGVAFSFFLLSFLLAPVVSAQDSAAISGTVTDPSGAVVAGANIAVKNADTGIVRVLVTDNAGRYRAFSLPVGLYEVHVKQSGFPEEIRTGIHLVVGQEAEVDLALRLGQASERITVNEDAPPVSVTNADISGLVGEQQVKELPLNGRSYDELLMLNPGVVNFTWEKTGGAGVSNSTTGNNFAVSGNRPQQNLFLLNGVEYTGAAENNMQPGGTSQQLLGVDAVREFNVLRDSYGAEYGKRPGAQVSIVTQSGANQFHGNVFEFLRNNALDARNFFDQTSAPRFQRNQFGASAGGPLKKDRTFLFGNYEGFRENLNQTAVTDVPDSNQVPTCAGACAGIVTQLLNLWPKANGPELLLPTGQPSGIAVLFATPLQTIREDFGTIRLDHTFSSKDLFGAIYTVDDSTDNTATVFWRKGLQAIPTRGCGRNFALFTVRAEFPIAGLVEITPFVNV